MRELQTQEDDGADLSAWSEHRDEQAFRRVVERHAGMVVATCRRRLGTTEQADEASQAVFIVLARRASAVRAGSVGPWLHRVAIGICRHALRASTRRQIHERKAAMMSITQEAHEVDWSDVRPHLDEAMQTLTEAQRAVVVEHFLRGQTQASIAGRLGISEDATRMRIQYALGRLRAWFVRRGMPVGAAALLAGLAGETSTAEPLAVDACVRAGIHPDSAVGAQALADADSSALHVWGMIAGALVLLLFGIIMAQGAVHHADSTDPQDPMAETTGPPPAGQPGSAAGPQTPPGSTEIVIPLTGHERTLEDIIDVAKRVIAQKGWDNRWAIRVQSVPTQRVQLDSRVLQSDGQVMVQDLRFGAVKSHAPDLPADLQQGIELVCSVPVVDGLLHVTMKNFNGQATEAVLMATRLEFSAHVQHFRPYMNNGIKEIRLYGNAQRRARLELFGDDGFQPADQARQADAMSTTASDSDDSQVIIGFGLGGSDNEAMELLSGEDSKPWGGNAN